MAYKKPNLYSMNRQEMLNNIAMSSSSGCLPNSGCGIAQQAPPGCGTSGVSGCHTNQVNDGPVCGTMSIGGCTCNASTPGATSTSGGGGCGSVTYNPTHPPKCNVNQSKGMSVPIDFESDDFISIDLDPHTNEIKITAGSAYPIEQLAELCRELYT